MGCWLDKRNDRAFSVGLEGKCRHLDGDSWNRNEVITKCFSCAVENGYDVFALQNGGECYAGYPYENYERHGASSVCVNGRGGPWSNNVYKLKGKLLEIIV